MKSFIFKLSFIKIIQIRHLKHKKLRNDDTDFNIQEILISRIFSEHTRKKARGNWNSQNVKKCGKILYIFCALERHYFWITFPK